MYDVPARAGGRDDRMFSATSARRHAHERLGIEAEEIDGGHYNSFSRLRALAMRLATYAREVAA